MRELLLFQSLFVCKTQSDIVELVQDQPHPAVFYKSFLEFDGANMTSILSFDSRSMGALLADCHSEYFSEKFPIFYRNKIQKSKTKYFYRSALDCALNNNQVKAVQLMINYIIKYQDSYVSSYLFQQNLPDLITKGVVLSDLFKSNVFSFRFDFEEWPSTHTDNEYYIRPFNGSIFRLREYYRTVFHEPEFKSLEDMIDDGDEQIDMSKVYKIKYSLNLLPNVGEYIVDADPEDETSKKKLMNEDINLMGLFNESDELSIYETDLIKELITYKWNTYAFGHHIKGCMFHLYHMLTLIIYIDVAYIKNIRGDDGTYHVRTFCNFIIFTGLVYPVFYEAKQLYRVGFVSYFTDLSNFVDITYIIAAASNILIQFYKGPFHLYTKGLMIYILLIGLVKTFLFLRIFSSLSPIVNMLRNVIYDLRIFLTFYLIMVVLFSLLIGIIGVGNPKIPGEF